MFVEDCYIFDFSGIDIDNTVINIKDEGWVQPCNFGIYPAYAARNTQHDMIYLAADSTEMSIESLSGYAIHLFLPTATFAVGTESEPE